MKSLLLRFLLICCAEFIKGEFDQDTIEGIDGLAELFRVPNQIPGLALAVVYNGNAYSTGYGVRDRERGLPVDKETIFMIASVSKGITGILAAKVVSEKFPTLGESALDTPVIHLVPNVNFTFSDKNRHESMTLRDLLAHRTCINTADNQIFLGGGFEDSFDYNYRSRYLGEICEFRSEFVYNNAMYDLAGHIIGMIAGKPFKQLAKEFFAQLGMTRTDYTTRGWNSQDNTAQAYYWTKTDEANPIKALNSSLLDRFSLFEGTGGITSCSEDMEKYINFHINKGKVGDQIVLPENVLNWVYKPSMNVGNNDYALGLGIGLYFDGSPWISHGGNVVPFEGFFGFVPKYNLGVYSVINGPGILTQSTHLNLHFAIHQFLLQGKKRNDLHIELPSNINVIENHDNVKQLLPTIHLNEILSKLSTNKDQITNIINFDGLFGNAEWGNFIVGRNNNLYTFIWGNYAIGNLHQFVEDPNYYWIEWTNDNESYLEAFMGPGNVPPYFIQMKDNNTLSLIGIIDFKRDATRETFPEIPWQ